MRPAHGAVAGLIRLISGVRPLPPATLAAGPSVFFANHSSHLDFAVIWAALPPARRATTRPVAGRDYWEQSPLRRFIAKDFFNAVLIERQRVTTATNPLEPMLAALDAGASLIVFPEGTRGSGEIQPFKPGLFHIARARPTIPLVPTCLENLNRILPKGEILAVPVLGSIRLGPALTLEPHETKTDFLARARQAVQALQRPS